MQIFVTNAPVKGQFSICRQIHSIRAPPPTSQPNSKQKGVITYYINNNFPKGIFLIFHLNMGHTTVLCQ